MFIMHPWYIVAPLIGIWILWQGRLRLSRRLVIWSFVFLACAYSAHLWTPQHFARIGCVGSMLEGMTCANGTMVTKFALLHQVLAILGVIFGGLVLPLIYLAVGVMEWRARQ
jgi:hypothetical protein